MSSPIDPSRSALPPVAQFLAEAALQRQSALLGPDKPQPAAPVPRLGGDPSSPPPSVSSPSPPAGPLPAPADRASISPQAREQLAAGLDPRGGGGSNGGLRGVRGDGRLLRPAPPALPGGAPAASGSAAASAASSGVGGVAWPASGLSAPLLRMVSALVAQITQQAGAPQRVVAAQPWPIGLAQALESGALDADQPPLQTWLVRQGVVATPEGPRGMALTLRAPVPWLASQQQQAQTAGTGAGAQVGAAGALQVPFAGGAQALQSGVMALVLQGMDAAAPRTSALLVLDLQPQLAATVYGRDMLQQAITGRLDPWTQMAVLQASGQEPREDERARNGASGLCDTVGCPYAARAACVQPFCLAMRSVLPAEAMGPGPRA